MPCIGSRNANPSTFGAGAIECRNRIWRTAACSATSQLSARRKTAHQSFVISLLQSRRFACAMPRIAQGKYISIRSGRYRVQKSYLAHRCVQRDDLRVPCLGSRNANPSTFGAGAIECRNLIWRTVACSATSQLSVSRKTAHQSFVISQLQSRRFACAMHRIAQRKSINIRS